MDPHRLLELEGHAPQRDRVAVLTPGYLRAMGISVLRGRDVVENDREVMLVSRDAAKLYWGTDDPIGLRAALPFSKTVLRRVIGIVGNVKQRNLIEASTPRCTSTRVNLMAGQRSPYGRRCRPPRSHSLPSQQSARSIQSSR